MTIALIAGTGGLPPVVAQAVACTGQDLVVCEMRGFACSVDETVERLSFRIETLGTFLETLKARGVSEVCMAGAVQRPDVDPSVIDPATAPLVPRLMAAMARGDDGTLREIIAIFQEAGFEVVGAHELAPELLPVAGVQTETPIRDLTADMAAADVAVSEMGQADMGQAVLVRDGAVIAREDARGTAALLADFSSELTGDNDGNNTFLGILTDAISKTAEWVSSTLHPLDALPGAGAVLYKAPKPNQILVADMPVIGPDTAMQAAEAGLDGIVIAHEKVMVLDLDQVITILDGQQMFLWVRA
ncbi:UDP-2,3-diacylglucosamine diphosphatase LpxI [Octadecabacter sp.]|nr:UDP-2,3-diacylglucosamine diphosphatase LpxI [Octadecabacter sp.]